MRRISRSACTSREKRPSRKRKRKPASLVQLAEYEAKQGRNYDPSNDFPPESYPPGFVFSRSAVLRRLEVDKRLKQAQELDLRGYLRCDGEDSDG